MKLALPFMSASAAAMYTPSEETAMMRIFDSTAMRVRRCHRYPPLKDQARFTRIFEYVFDDIGPDFEDPDAERTGKSSAAENGYVIFDDAIAKRIISDARSCLHVPRLAIHCYAGMGRSPAVGIALNEIFELGEDSDALIREYPKINAHVLKTMLKAAAEIGIWQPDF